MIQTFEVTIKGHISIDHGEGSESSYLHDQVEDDIADALYELGLNKWGGYKNIRFGILAQEVET